MTFTLALVFLPLVYSRPTEQATLRTQMSEDGSPMCCNGQHGSRAYDAMAHVSHRFAFELISENVAKFGNKDIALSPYSIMSVLQALSLGTRGDTRLEIDNKLLFPSKTNHELIKCSLENFQQDSNVTIIVASQLFADEYLMESLNPEFARELKYYYHSDVVGVPFIIDPVSAWRQINEFVENKTMGVVSDFMNRWDSTELMYVNTIVFKGQWKHQFDKTKTSSGAFYLHPSKTINLPMMTVDGVFRSATLESFKFFGDNMKVLELPYSDEKYSMYIFMAETGKLDLSFIESVISQYTIPVFRDHYLQNEERPLRLYLPKFKISSEIDISRTLYNIGVRKLFTNEADLSGIFKDKVYFNKMFHKSVIEVTEEGTIAAGATSAFTIRSYEATEEFIVNRPFVYVIHDACNNMVLFQGRFYGGSS